MVAVLVHRPDPALPSAPNVIVMLASDPDDAHARQCDYSAPLSTDHAMQVLLPINAGLFSDPSCRTPRAVSRRATIHVSASLQVSSGSGACFRQPL